MEYRYLTTHQFVEELNRHRGCIYKVVEDLSDSPREERMNYLPEELVMDYVYINDEIDEPQIEIYCLEYTEPHSIRIKDIKEIVDIADGQYAITSDTINYRVLALSKK